MISSLLAFLFLSLFSRCTFCQDDPPEYTAWINKLFSFSAKQTYYIDTWKLPDVSANPSISPWVFDDDPLHPNVIISWCGGGYSCPYYVMSLGKTKEEWKKVKSNDNFEVFFDHSGAGRHPFKGGDIRLFLIEGELHMTWVGEEGHLQVLNFARVYYSRGLDALYVVAPVCKADIREEVGERNQKNWMPFIYDFASNKQLAESRSKGVRRNGTETFYVYSINPHRIVYGNETAADGDTKFRTITSSEAVYPELVSSTETHTTMSEDKSTSTTVSTTVTREVPSALTTGEATARLWPYGDPHGGTPAVLVQTKYGPRYVTLFHSQGKFGTPYIKTYYMGGYLFSAEPPFEITHITPEPIIPRPLYSEANGWAFKAIDYIVFPCGLLVREDIMYVTLGRNDNSGWVLLMNLTGFVDSLVPIRTKVTENKFYKHLAYADGAEGVRHREKKRSLRSVPMV